MSGVGSQPCYITPQNSARRLKKQRQINTQYEKISRSNNKSPIKFKQIVPSLTSLDNGMFENLSRNQGSRTQRILYTERASKSKKMTFEEDKPGS